MPKISRVNQNCGSPVLETPYPDILRQVDVGQRLELVDVPEFERTEEVPVGPRRKVPNTMSEDHNTAKPNRKIVISAFRSLNVKYPIPLRILVDIGDAKSARR